MRTTRSTTIRDSGITNFENTRNRADTGSSSLNNMIVPPLTAEGDYASTYETYTSSLFKGVRKRIKVKYRKADDPNDHSPQLRLNWSEEEHEKFVFAIKLFANDKKKWNKVAEYIGTRTPHQCRGHHSAYTGHRYKNLNKKENNNM